MINISRRGIVFYLVYIPLYDVSIVYYCYNIKISKKKIKQNTKVSNERRYTLQKKNTYCFNFWLNYFKEISTKIATIALQ